MGLRSDSDYGLDGLRDSLYSLLGYDSEQEMETDGGGYDHLEGIDDGCGCAEVWEELSDQRSELSPEDLE